MPTVDVDGNALTGNRAIKPLVNGIANVGELRVKGQAGIVFIISGIGKAIHYIINAS